MAIALIGDTGFVGRNLLRQLVVNASYNSRTIDAIVGQRFDLLIIAAAPGVKWRANQDPQTDAASIARLTSALEQATARRVVLISTVDVYPCPVGVTESSPIAHTDVCAYGRHRLALETFVASRFDAVVLRLPGLFGQGLKKNVVFDLLTHHQCDRLNPESTFQWYPLDRLWIDTRLALANNLRLVNLVTEPVRTADMAQEVFGIQLRHAGPSAPARYDVRSEHAGRLGGRGGYLADRSEVLRRLARFVCQARMGV